MWAGDAVAERFAGVQQNFFETTIQAHALVFGQIVEQRRQPFLQPHRHVYALDFQRRSRIEQLVPEIVS